MSRRTQGHPKLLRRGEGGWQLRKRDEGVGAQIIPLGQVPFYAELAVACGAPREQYTDYDVVEPLAIETPRHLDPARHFVVRAAGDSMNGGTMPIADGALVLCEWTTAVDACEIQGKPTLLAGGVGEEFFATLKIPLRIDGRWVLRSANPAFPDQLIDPGVTLRVVARPLEVVTERIGAVLWGLYDRDAIAGLFGHENNPSWRTGHRDVEVDGQPHTILMVNLRKPVGTPVEHRYADAFLSADEFQWESQATTTVGSAKGRRIIAHDAEGRAIHLFVRYHTKDADGKGEPFTYCGAVHTLRHEGQSPIRVWFRLENPLPKALWRAWADV